MILICFIFYNAKIKRFNNRFVRLHLSTIKNSFVILIPKLLEI
jgi:hypothetical protein